MIEYRRQKVSEMLVEGASQYSIASSLGVSQATISKDVEYLEANAKEQTKRIVEDKLPHAHLQALQGINNIIKLGWETARSTKRESVRLQSLVLISQCYQLRDNFMSDTKTIAATTAWIEKRRRKIADVKEQELSNNSSASLSEEESKPNTDSRTF